MDETWWSRIEDASLNASAPPQQRWLDGWMLRYSPGKARRARCINALAEGRLPLHEKLQMAGDVYQQARLPMVVRVTPFSQPGTLDGQLHALGFAKLDTTRVLARSLSGGTLPALPPGVHWVELGADEYARAVGALRGSPADQQLAHAQRLAWSPVPYRGYAICSDGDGSVLACGQSAQEADITGLYDVHTAERARRQGLAALLCERMLTLASRQGARFAYLQTEADNHTAGRVYQRLGFVEAYRYHYRQAA